jgi:exopolysaccharide production protein ExoQ
MTLIKSGTRPSPGSIHRGTVLPDWEVTAGGSLSLAEGIFTVLMLFYTANAVGPRAASTVVAVKAAFYGLASLFILVRWRRVIQGLLNIKWILALTLLAAASALWSNDPFQTLRGSATLFASTAFGVYLGTRYTVVEQLRLLAWTCFLFIVPSYLIAILLPSYGVQHDWAYDAWKGVFMHKNALAETAVFAVLVLAFVRPMARWQRCLAMIASFGLVLLSRSATGLIVCCFIVVLLLLLVVIRVRLVPVILAALSAGIVLTGLLMVFSPGTEQVLQFLNRRPDLTGRTGLWAAVLDAISKKPWLGYGFSAFWQTTNREVVSIHAQVGWIPGYAHNGFLDLALYLGIVGLAMFAFGYLVLWRRALVLVFEDADAPAMWMCMYLLFMLLYNLTEGSILRQNNIYWILYISTAVCLSLPRGSISALHPLDRTGPQPVPLPEKHLARRCR